MSSAIPTSWSMSFYYIFQQENPSLFTKKPSFATKKLDTGENWDDYGPTKGFSIFGLKAIHFQESTLIAAWFLELNRVFPS